MNYLKIPLRLATALLLSNGEISIGEIRALPLVDDTDFALAIAEVLEHNFKLERYELDTSESLSKYDEVLRFVSPLVHSHEQRESLRIDA